MQHDFWQHIEKLRVTWVEKYLARDKFSASGDWKERLAPFQNPTDILTKISIYKPHILFHIKGIIKLNIFALPINGQSLTLLSYLMKPAKDSTNFTKSVQQDIVALISNTSSKWSVEICCSPHEVSNWWLNSTIGGCELRYMVIVNDCVRRMHGKSAGFKNVDAKQDTYSEKTTKPYECVSFASSPETPHNMAGDCRRSLSGNYGIKVLTAANTNADNIDVNVSKNSHSKCFSLDSNVNLSQNSHRKCSSFDSNVSEFQNPQSKCSSLYNNVNLSQNTQSKCSPLHNNVNELQNSHSKCSSLHNNVNELQNKQRKYVSLPFPSEGAPVADSKYEYGCGNISNIDIERCDDNNVLRHDYGYGGSDEAIGIFKYLRGLFSVGGNKNKDVIGLSPCRRSGSVRELGEIGVSRSVNAQFGASNMTSEELEKRLGIFVEKLDMYRHKILKRAEHTMKHEKFARQRTLHELQEHLADGAKERLMVGKMHIQHSHASYHYLKLHVAAMKTYPVIQNISLNHHIFVNIYIVPASLLRYLRRDKIFNSEPLRNAEKFDATARIPDDSQFECQSRSRESEIRNGMGSAVVNDSNAILYRNTNSDIGIKYHTLMPMNRGGTSLTTFNAVKDNGIAINGLETNGTTVNGLKPDGIAINGLETNGTTVNGLKPNGIAVNGLDTNGTTINGLETNGTTVNRLETNGAKVNEIEANGITMSQVRSNLASSENKNEPLFNLVNVIPISWIPLYLLSFNECRTFERILKCLSWDARILVRIFRLWNYSFGYKLSDWVADCFVLAVAKSSNDQLTNSMRNLNPEHNEHREAYILQNKERRIVYHIKMLFEFLTDLCTWILDVASAKGRRNGSESEAQFRTNQKTAEKTILFSCVPIFEEIFSIIHRETDCCPYFLFATIVISVGEANWKFLKRNSLRTLECLDDAQSSLAHLFVGW